MRKRSRFWVFALLLLLAGGMFYGARLMREQEAGPQTPWLWHEAQTSEAPTTTRPPLTQPVTLSQAGRVRYHYSQLSAAEQQAYQAIETNLPYFPEVIDIAGLNSDAMARVFQALLLDQPLLFQISSTHYKTRTLQGEITGFLPEYRLTEAEYKTQCRVLAQVCKVYLENVEGGDYDAELALHDQLVRACDYTENIKDPVNNTAYGALVNRSAACEGYAKAMLLLLELRGMEGYIVTGEASNAANVRGGHAWNKVKVDGEWYQLDVTWDDPVTEDGSRRASSLSHAYFNLTDADMGISHEINDTQNPCTATRANYFVREGLLFSELEREDETKLAQRLAENLNAGGNCLELRFASAQALQHANSYLFDKTRQRVYRILANANLAVEQPICIDRVYHAEMTALRVVRIFPEFE